MAASDKMTHELELLLEVAPPEQLKHTIRFMLLQYLINSEQDNPPKNHIQFYENIYFLLDFLDKAEALQNA
jgi:uncharacterized protein Yka (UPF0111/DUF47 family)